MIEVTLSDLTSEHTRDAVRVDVTGDTATIYTADDALPAPPPATLADVISATVAAIDAHAAALRDAATAGIHPAEMASWPLKLAEAQAFDASGNPGDAPMLGIEAATRGVPLADMVARVLAKAAMLAQLEAAISGTAGRHNDAVKAMGTVEYVLAYDWQSGWPDMN